MATRATEISIRDLGVTLAGDVANVSRNAATLYGGDNKPSNTYLSSEFSVPSETKQEHLSGTHTFADAGTTQKSAAPEQYELYRNTAEVAGSVLAIEEESVLCELYLAQQTTNIWLPRSLFPVSIYYGCPIAVGIDESQGIRRPYVNLRSVNSKEAQSDIAYVQGIIDKM